MFLTTSVRFACLVIVFVFKLTTLVTQLKGPKGKGDMQAVNAPPTRDLSIWLCGRAVDRFRRYRR